MNRRAAPRALAALLERAGEQREDRRIVFAGVGNRLWHQPPRVQDCCELPRQLGAVGIVLQLGLCPREDLGVGLFVKHRVHLADDPGDLIRRRLLLKGEQRVRGDAQQPGDRLDERDVRQALSVLPLVDGRRRHAEAAGHLSCVRFRARRYFRITSPIDMAYAPLHSFQANLKNLKRIWKRRRGVSSAARIHCSKKTPKAQWTLR